MHLFLKIKLENRVTNLQSWTNNEAIIQKTLDEFNTLTSGYSSVRLLSKLETVNYLLQNYMVSFHDIPFFKKKIVF